MKNLTNIPDSTGYNTFETAVPTGTNYRSPNAEHSVLGAIMLDSKAFDRITVPLTGQDFVDTQLGRVFDAAKKIHQEDIHPDVVIIAEEMEALGMSNVVPLVYDIAKNTPSAKNINAYAAVVVELSDARRYQASLKKSLAALDANPHAIREIAAAHKKRIEGLKLRCEGTPDVAIESAAATTVQPINWLWNGWLAQGKLHILGGAPGTGKTTLAMALASTVSQGGTWPDGTPSPQGDVVIWSGEDSPDDTLVPRLMQAEAMLKHVHFITGIKQRSFDPATDIEQLREAMQAFPNAKMLIMDPIVSAIPGDSHKNAEVRRGLQPLTDLAMEYGVALIGITHFTKGTNGRDPVERITGSIAFGAMARIVMVTAKPKQADAPRLLVRAKSNIGPDDGGFEYDLKYEEVDGHPGVEAAFALWGSHVEGTARELLASADDEPTEDRTKAGDGNRLLADIKAYIQSHPAKAYPTAELLRYLNSMGDESPWPTYAKGMPLTARHLADLLRPFKIVATNIRVSPVTIVKGYKVTSFEGL